MSRPTKAANALFLILLAPIAVCVGLCSGGGNKQPRTVYTPPVQTQPPLSTYSPLVPTQPQTTPVETLTVQPPPPVEAQAEISTEDVTGESFEAKVFRVFDGDTLSVLNADKEQIKIRLEGIDAPETEQEYSKASTTFLKGATGLRTIRIQPTGTDKYGQMLAYLYDGNVNINEKILKAGWAWHFKECNSEQYLADAETEAKSARKGLWKSDNPMPPWEYRHLGDQPKEIKSQQPESVLEYWLNTSSGVRHNQGCQHFGRTKRGRYCGPNEGKACGICGG